MPISKLTLAPFTLAGVTQCPKCVSSAVKKTYASAANEAEVRRTGVPEWLLCKCLDCSYSWETEVAKVAK